MLTDINAGRLFLYGAGADCKSVAIWLTWFDSKVAHQFRDLNYLSSGGL